MEFGLVETKQLAKIDFGLPKEPAANKEILLGRKAKDAMVFVGCAKWGRKEWLGKIYPPKTKEKNFLQEYVQHFNSIELNATHYKIFGATAVSEWRKKAAGKEFKFCPKMYQGVTHRGNLKGKQFTTAEFLRGISRFEETLGPVFLQFSDRFSPKRKTELLTYLRSLPADKCFFVELRHPGWFLEPHWSEMLDALRLLHIGIVITDAAGRRDCCHMRLTLPKTLIRFVGNSLHPTDYTRCDAWVKRIKFWLKNGMEELYFFMHMHDEAFSPELADYVVRALNKQCGLSIKPPLFLPAQS